MDRTDAAVREVAARDQRKAYEKPVLTDYGSFADLTQIPYKKEVP